jgi:Zn-dependent M16 (insulinase) family peptidase
MLSHGFDLRTERDLPEAGGTVRLYVHEETGAELISVICDDENKVFGVSFRTPPSDSTGIAHILEHSVLCGSRKYPVKAPFLEMLKSSLNTFLNAMTYGDKTVYPVGSVNPQDFYNLVDVYLDAVFHPRLTPDVLKQEGWHYELETPDAPLIYKGVVFNEMKGSYSSPDDRVRRLSQRSLYPDTTYGVDSGGDPAEIPNLTFENFKRFHERLYHPSNAKLFFYGNDDPEKRLEILDGVLSDFSRIEVDSTVALQPRFNAPRTLAFPFPAASSAAAAKEARVTVNWMLDEAASIDTQLALSLMSSILTETPASPLRKALIDSRLGSDLTGTGLGTTLRQMQFGAGLKGIDPADAGKVEALILGTLERLASDGLDPATVEAAVNLTEFRLRENNTGFFPRGIGIMLRALSFWNYDRDPFAPLAWSEPLERLKARLAAGDRVFEPLIRTQLLDNPHRTTVLFTPDPDLSRREAEEERARLNADRAAMSRADLERIVQETRALKLKQETPDTSEALATLPRLRLADLPQRETPIPIEVGALAGAKYITHDLPTNGILYLDLGFDMRVLPPALLPYVGVFRTALLETGAGDMDMVQLSQRIGRSTGGVSTGSLISAVVGENASAAWLFLRAKAVPEKAEELVAILTEILVRARLDNRERIEQLIDEARAGVEASLTPSGHAFALARLRASLTENGWAAEQMGGVSYLFALRRMTAEMKDRPDSVIETLETIRRLLLQRGAMVVNLTADASHISGFEPALARLIEAVPEGAAPTQRWLAPELPRFEGLTMPAKVNYVAKGARLPRLGHAPNGAAFVASHWLRGGWLWDKVRVQGGAYGAHSVLDMRSGTFAFDSYRDPNLLDTVAVYDGAGPFLRSAAANATELERAIIGAIGAIDRYMLPDAKGRASLERYLTKDDDERRQRIREEVLSTTPTDIRRFADALDAVAAHGRVVVLGAPEAIEAANAKLEDRFTLTKVL